MFRYVGDVCIMHIALHMIYDYRLHVASVNSNSGLTGKVTPSKVFSGHVVSLAQQGQNKKEVGAIIKRRA